MNQISKWIALKEFVKQYHNYVIYLAVLLMLNVVGVKIFKHLRLDITRHQSHSISRVSKDLVDKLADPLRIRVFYSKNLPPPYDGVERILKDLLSEYNLHANRYFNYQFYDCSEGKEDTSEKIKDNVKKAADFGIYAQQIQNVEKDEVKFIKAYMGLVIQHGDMIERIPFIKGGSGLEYQITSIIQKMINKISVLQGLPEKINLKLFLPSEFQEVAGYFQIKGIDALADKVKEAVEKSNKRNYGKLDYVHLKDSSDEVFKQEAGALELRSLAWKNFRNNQGANIKAGNGYAALVVEYGDKKEALELLEVRQVLTFGGIQQKYELKDVEKIDEDINNLVDGLLDINDKVAYLSDHGTVSIQVGNDNPYMRQLGMGGQEGGEGANFNSLISSVYSIEQVTISDIDTGVNALVIAGANQRFSDYELFQIDQFLMHGRSLVFFQDAIEVIEPPPGRNQFQQQQQQIRYNPLNTGLEKLIAHYGVKIKQKYVLDKSCYEQFNRGFDGRTTGKQDIYFAPKIVGDGINSDFDVIENIKEFYLLRTSPLEIDKEQLKEKKIRPTLLFKSSKEAWEKESLGAGTDFPPEDDQMSQKDLAYLLEGEFTSYFADKGIPQKKSEAGESVKGNKNANQVSGENAFIKKGKPGKVLVIGSSEVIKNSFIMKEGNNPNSILALNLIDYMVGKKDWAIMRSKVRTFNPIEDYDKKANVVVRFFTNRGNLKFFNIFGIPLLIAFAGVVVYRRNLRQRRLIQEEFK